MLVGLFPVLAGHQHYVLIHAQMCAKYGAKIIYIYQDTKKRVDTNFQNNFLFCLW